jgi:hypothetical protein
MVFKIQPKVMTAEELEVKVIGHTDTEVQFWWGLKTVPSGKVIDSGNWSLPKSSFLLLGSIELDAEGCITDPNLKGAVGQILSDPAIDIVLGDPTIEE